MRRLKRSADQRLTRPSPRANRASQLAPSGPRDSLPVQRFHTSNAGATHPPARRSCLARGLKPLGAMSF
ncbi:MAG: hypothetical protein AAFY67_14755 [Cyanobacteria bacterium J06642_9]